MMNTNDFYAKMLKEIFAEAAAKRNVEMKVIVAEAKEYVKKIEEQQRKRLEQFD